MNNLKLLFTERQIQHNIKLLAKKINKDYQNSNLVVMGILNGGVYLTVDLTKHLTVDHELTFVQLSSYVDNVQVKEVEIKKYWDVKLQDKDVLIVEDLIDSGESMKCLLLALERVEPKSVKIATLIKKLTAPIQPDYYCGIINDEWVVGMGLDNNGKQRQLTNIYELLKTKPK